MINLPGVTFSFQRVPPAADASFQQSVLSDGVLRGCAMSAAGFTLTIQPGYILCAGRIIHVDTVKTLAVDGATSGYARLVVTVDLTRTTTLNAFQQVELDVQYASSVGGFPSLVKDDINAGSGNKYQAALAVMSLGTAGVMSITAAANAGLAAAKSSVVYLPQTAWSENTQTVSVPGVSEDTSACRVIVSCDPSDDARWAAWSNADVRCAAQLPGALTFKATSTPTLDLYANVLIL